MPRRLATQAVDSAPTSQASRVAQHTPRHSPCSGGTLVGLAALSWAWRHSCEPLRRAAGSSTATPAAAARRASDLTVLLADTDTVAVEHGQQTHTVSVIFRMARPNGGGTSTLLKVSDVLLLAGCGKKAVQNKGACKYMEDVVFKNAHAGIVPETRYVLVNGLAMAPVHYVFVDGAIAIIFYKLDSAKAVVLTRSLMEAVDRAADAMEEADPVQAGDAVTPASRRVAAWLSGLLSWRGVLRQLLGVLTSAQAAFVHSWVLGVKSELSTSAGELKRRVESIVSTAVEKLAAQRSLAERAAAGWSLLRETVALSAIAKKEATAAAALEERVAQSYADAEQQELNDRRRLAAAGRQRAQVLREDAESDEEVEEGEEDAGPGEEGKEGEIELDLSRADRKAVSQVAAVAAAATRAKLLADGRRAQIASSARVVDEATQQLTDDVGVALFADSALLDHMGFGSDPDPDEMALLCEMFRSKRDLLVRLERQVACTEAEAAVKYYLRERFRPLSVAATAQTQLAAGFGPRFTDSTLGTFWSQPASILGLRSPFATEREVKVLFDREAARWTISTTPIDSPDGCKLPWKGLPAAGVTFEALQVLQYYVNIESVAACIDVDDDDPDDLLYAKVSRPPHAGTLSVRHRIEGTP